MECGGAGRGSGDKEQGPGREPAVPGPWVNGRPHGDPLSQVTADLVRRLHLEAHVDKPVAAYSGGTKRKLSTALALLGQPDLLFLVSGGLSGVADALTSQSCSRGIFKSAANPCL